MADRIIGIYPNGDSGSWCCYSNSLEEQIRKLQEGGITVVAVMPKDLSKSILEYGDYEWNMEQARINGWLYEKVKSPAIQDESVLIEYVDERGVNCSYIRPTEPVNTPDEIWKATMAFMGGFCNAE